MIRGYQCYGTRVCIRVYESVSDGVVSPQVSPKKSFLNVRWQTGKKRCAQTQIPRGVGDVIVGGLVTAS